MLFSITTILALGASAVIATPFGEASTLCGTKVTEAQKAIMEADFAAKMVVPSEFTALAAVIPVCSTLYCLLNFTDLSSGALPCHPEEHCSHWW